MSKCPYNPPSCPCDVEVQLMVANAAEDEASEMFHEMDAEICKLLQRIQLLEKTLQQHDIPIPNVEDWYFSALPVRLLAENQISNVSGQIIPRL